MPKLNRRTLISTTAAAASVVTAFKSSSGGAAILSHDFQPRGQIGRLERLPTLDLQSNEDFLTTFRVLVNGDMVAMARARADEILTAQGLDPNAEATLEDALELLGDDEVIGSYFQAWSAAQQQMWKNIRDQLYENADQLLEEMEAADKMGPGSLELNPGIEPDWAKYEIHQQPGGYVGDPFAGHIYHYGTNDFYMNANDQDRIHRGLARITPKPKDGVVNRIHEVACGCGQMAQGFKEFNPNAEVWASDIGAPMVRYAHMRSVDLGLAVNFRQALAEESGFPDDHFDIVASYLQHHECPAESTKATLREVFRTLRPGGVFFPIDFFTGLLPPPTTAFDKLYYWWHHRWNQEVWYEEYASVDMAAEMRKVGFEVTEIGSTGRGAEQRADNIGVRKMPYLLATKPA